MSFSLLISALTIPEAVRGLVLNNVSDFTGLLFFWSSSQFSLNDELSTLAEMVLHGLGGELDMLDFFLCFFDRLQLSTVSTFHEGYAYIGHYWAQKGIVTLLSRRPGVISQIGRARLVKGIRSAWPGHIRDGQRPRHHSIVHS